MTAEQRQILAALAGNPNCGKTTLFNEITGARQHVGNYPGITVEKKEGTADLNGSRVNLVDLPGTYSLTAYSLEELVARDFLINERPHVVINIVDASNLERNLYLTVQLLELGVPLVLALNMIDAAESRGIHVKASELSRRLQVPVIPTVAKTGRGKRELLETALCYAREEQPWRPINISYGPDMDPVLDAMEREISNASLMTDSLPARWTALKYLEADEQVIARGRTQDPELSDRLEARAAEVTEHLRKTLDTYPEAVIADHRYGFIAAVLKEGVVSRDEKANRLHVSDQLDRILANRLFGPLIMLVILYMVYQFTFKLSEGPVALMEFLFSALSRTVDRVLPEGPLKSLLISGIIDGVGGIFGFIPLVLFMFFCIALLEDTGYLARVAYMLDRVFRTFGLHGNSVMAFIISGGIAGGCAVPGVLATRTLRSSRERLATLLTAPFMNCGAKLPVFAMLIAAFFPARQAQMMFLLTLLSWGIALTLAKVIRSTMLRGPSTPFLLELPPYRIPTFKGLMIHTWERTWQYIRKAGTIILAVSIVMWALMSYPALPDERLEAFEARKVELVSDLLPHLREGEPSGEGLTAAAKGEYAARRSQIEALEKERASEALRYSFAGRLGTALEPVSHWCGFDWRTNVALVSGFAAKEIILATLGTAYSLGESKDSESPGLSDRLSGDPEWNPLKALSLIIFIMLYAPCLATITCIIKESGAWKWGFFSLVFNTSVAFCLATIVYQVGHWAGWGG